MRKVLIGVLVLLVVVAGVVYYALSNLDEIVKELVEKTGSNVLGTAVTVQSVDIAISEGRGTIKGLSVANPPGYSNKPAFAFAEITIDIASARVIERIYAEAPEIRIESKGAESNLKTLLDNISGARQGEPRAADPEQPEPDLKEEREEPEKQPLTLRIDLVEIEAARATVVAAELEQPVEVVIERLRFTDLNGTPRRLARQLARQLIAQVLAEAAREALMTKGRQVLESAGENLDQKLKGLLEKLSN
jgi:hypothetical protein